MRKKFKDNMVVDKLIKVFIRGYRYIGNEDVFQRILDNETRKICYKCNKRGRYYDVKENNKFSDLLLYSAVLGTQGESCKHLLYASMEKFNRKVKKLHSKKHLNLIKEYYENNKEEILY